MIKVFLALALAYGLPWIPFYVQTLSACQSKANELQKQTMQTCYSRQLANDSAIIALWALDDLCPNPECLYQIAEVGFEPNALEALLSLLHTVSGGFNGCVLKSFASLSTPMA